MYLFSLDNNLERLRARTQISNSLDHTACVVVHLVLSKVCPKTQKSSFMGRHLLSRPLHCPPGPHLSARITDGSETEMKPIDQRLYTEGPARGSTLRKPAKLVLKEFNAPLLHLTPVKRAGTPPQGPLHPVTMLPSSLWHKLYPLPSPCISVPPTPNFDCLI